MLFSLPHHPKSWTRESKKGRNRSKRTCMGLSCLSRTLIREVSQTSVRLLMDQDLLLVTLDVKSLYPSIPQGPGIEMALQRVVPTTPPTSREHQFKNMLRDFLRIILGDNHFQFGEKFYDQKKGVAMGTKCAPQLANLFMASLEEKALNSWPGPQPIKWLRFLDDVFMLWQGSEEQLSTFHDHLNDQMHGIKFTMEASRGSATFLDLTISKGQRFRETGKLDVSLHIKETNPQCFLHSSSCHPFATFRTILRGEIMRTLRCTSSPVTFITNLEKLLDKFRSRGYPEWLIRQEADRTSHINRDTLMKPTTKRTLEEDVSFFSATFTPGISSSKIRRALEDKETPFQPMVLRPRPTSIQDQLVRARVGHKKKL